MADITNFLRNRKHFLRATVANLAHGFPSKKLTTIGVTGTDGKTTTSLMIYHVLKNCGLKAGYITTVGYNIGGGSHDSGFHTTTPDVFKLQKLIKEAVTNGLKYLVIETSSHGLDQHRVWGINFTVGLITNVTHEHLDYHKNFKDYLNKKAKLLKASKYRVLNKDDNNYRTLSKRFPKHLSFSLYKRADVNLINTRLNLKGFTKFNLSNALAAIAVCQYLHIKKDIASKYLRSFKLPPGRLHIIQSKPVKVIIDFAHTPNGLFQFLSSVKKTRNLLHVFGSAGERDASKRPSMGNVSSQFADVIILTSEDPRSESFSQISKEIKRGILKSRFKGKLLEIQNRETAIKTAINMSRKGDVVVVTGKGHEKSMNIGGIEYPWDEVKIVKKLLKKTPMTQD